MFMITTHLNGQSFSHWVIPFALPSDKIGQFVPKCLFALFLFTVDYFACLARGQQVSVIANKHILTPEDQNVILHCVSYGLHASPYNVVVFTVMDEVVYNSSNINQLASYVKVINRTSIAYSNIVNGVTDVSCSINHTTSFNPTTITYIRPVFLIHSPSDFFRLTTFYRATCLYSIKPDVPNKIVVNFTLNQTTFGQYLYPPIDNVLQFARPTKISGLNVVKGSNESSIIYIQPTKPSAEGKYQCSITIPSSNVTVKSNVWDTTNTNSKSNSTNALIPSNILILFAILTLSYFVGSFMSQEV